MTVRAGRGDDGFTMIELAVVMLLLGILMTGATATFISVQRATSDNFVRQADTQDAQVAMDVISRDVRAIADDQTNPAGPVPLIATMGANVLVAAVNLDTTVNDVAAAGASAYTGCPDQVTITGAASPGPVTETRTHPNPNPSQGAPNAVCSWTPTTANTYTRTIATYATVQFAYLTAAGAVTSTAATTSKIQITVTVPAVHASGTVATATLVQTTPLASFSDYQATLGS